ncbi:NACHT, LRR and PYD domains-containing protein 1b allele 2-like isoform X2 [Rhinoraja longicauda]
MSDDSDESNSFEVTVLLADGKEVRVDVRPDDTIEDVKGKVIAEIEGSSWSLDLFTLMSGHLPLNDDDTVAESGLRAESAIVQNYTTPDGSGNIDYTIAGTFPQGTSSDWTTSVAFEPSTTESEHTSGHGNRFLELGYNRLKSCDICGLKDEETKWRVIEPQVSEHDMHFRIYFPEEGFYECLITGLRWEIKSAITIAYRYCSWNEYAPIIVIKETEYCGPLFNIVAEDNIVTAIHLPHFVCLKDRNRKKIFAIFYVREQSYKVQEPSEVHETHVELQMPTFSLLGVIIDKTSQFSCHSLTVIYQTQYTDAAVLHIYVVPHDFSVIQALHKQESESILIKHPSQITSLYFGRKYSVKCSSKVQIEPDEMKFQCTDIDSLQPFYEVIITEEPRSFKLKLTKRKKDDPLWQISLTYQNGKVSCQENLDKDISQKKGAMPMKKESLTSDSTDPLENINVDLGSASPVQISSDSTDPLENINVDLGSASPVQISSGIKHIIKYVCISFRSGNL